MILPILAYGDSLLRRPAGPVPSNYAELQSLIQNMYETMYNAEGVGLAAPQVGVPLRLFVVDGAPMQERSGNTEDLTQFKQVFINAEALDQSGDPWGFEEGCLSIPTIREEVQRPAILTLHYWDEHWQEHTETFTGVKARILQHEYDHTLGKLFLDYCSPLKRQLLKPKLLKIAKGGVPTDYPMRFATKVRAKV